MRARRGLLLRGKGGGSSLSAWLDWAASLGPGACVTAEPLRALLSRGRAYLPPGGTFSPTERSCKGIPALSARGCWDAAPLVGALSLGRHRFVDVSLFSPLVGALRGLFCVPFAHPASGSRIRLFLAEPPPSPAGSSVLPLGALGGAGVGFASSSHAHFARQRSSSASVNVLARPSSVSLSAARWISIITHTPQLTPSGCLGDSIKVLSNVAAPIGLPDCSACTWSTYAPISLSASARCGPGKNGS